MKKRVLIRQRLRNYFAAFSLVPVILFCGILTIYISASAWRDSRLELAGTLSIVRDRLDQILQEAYQVGRSASEDEAILKQLGERFATDAQRYLSEMELDNALTYISRYFDTEIQLYIFGENGGQYKSGMFSFKDGDFREEDWYRAIMKSTDAVWFPVYEGSHAARDDRSSFVSLGVPMKNRGTGHAIGAALVEIRVDGILGGHGQMYIIDPNLEMNIVDGRVEQYENDVVMTLDEGGVKVLGKLDPKPAYVERTMNAVTYWRAGFPESSFLSANGYQLAYNRVPANNWILVNTMQTAQLYKTPIIIGLSLALGILCLSLIAVLASGAAARTVTRPIMALTDSVHMVREDNFDVVIDKLGDDEIGDLSDQFNKMVAHIKELMARIYREQSDRRKYELLLLQAQINPHFLYNTLDSMLWLVRMKRNEEAATMLTALTTFFKTGLNKGRDTIMLSQELANVRSYMTIQQFRYKSKLRYEAQIEPGVNEIVVPKLILQPLIENAIYHGIKGKDGPGRIWLKCEDRDGSLRIEVGDDGLGMSDELLNRLRSQLKGERAGNRDSYGVINVYERLRLFFPGRCEMKIDSRESEGTLVTIVIAKEEGVCSA